VIPFLIVVAVLAGTTSLVAWVIHLETQHAEREDYRFRALHPSQRRAIVSRTPADEHVRRIGPAPYDWQSGDDDGES
jgi:hypothetical protein